MNTDQPEHEISTRRHLLGWMIALAGLIVLVHALSETFGQPEVPWHSGYVYVIEKSGSNLTGSHHAIKQSNPLILSLHFTGGICAWVAAYVIIKRRVSLRLLLAAALVAGALGSLPAIYAQPRGAIAEYSIVFEKALADEQIDAIREALEPRRAFATLPPELLKELDLKNSLGIESVEVAKAFHSRHEGPKTVLFHGVKMKLSTMPHLTLRQRNVLTEFYMFYLEVMATEFAVENGTIEPRAVRTHLSGSFKAWMTPWYELREERKAAGK